VGVSGSDSARRGARSATSRRGLAQERANVVGQRGRWPAANGVSCGAPPAGAAPRAAARRASGELRRERLQVGQRRARHAERGRSWPGCAQRGVLPRRRAASDRRRRRTAASVVLRGGAGTKATSCTSRATMSAGRPARGRSARPAPWSPDRASARRMSRAGRRALIEGGDQRERNERVSPSSAASRSESGPGRSCARSDRPRRGASRRGAPRIEVVCMSSAG